MKKKNIKTLALSVAMVSMLALTGCGDDAENTAENADKEVVELQEKETEEEKGFWDASFSTETTIAYSAGNDNNWSYGNQRKEFPVEDACYVRIGCIAKTDKGKGEDNEIVVTYRFTGTEKCAVNLSDGIAEKVDTEDANVVEYTRTLYAKKEKKATEDIVIFQYVPTEGAESVTLEVIYDDQIEERYDARNAVYFVVTEEDTDVRRQNGTK